MTDLATRIAQRVNEQVHNLHERDFPAQEEWYPGCPMLVKVIREELEGGEQGDTGEGETTGEPTLGPAAPDQPHEFTGRNAECCLKMRWFGGQAVRCNRPADDPIHEVNDGSRIMGNDRDSTSLLDRDVVGDVGRREAEVTDDGVYVGPGDEVVANDGRTYVVRGVMDCDTCQIIVQLPKSAIHVLSISPISLATLDGKPVLGYREDRRASTLREAEEYAGKVRALAHRIDKLELELDIERDEHHDTDRELKARIAELEQELKEAKASPDPTVDLKRLLYLEARNFELEHDLEHYKTRLVPHLANERDDAEFERDEARAELAKAWSGCESWLRSKGYVRLTDEDA